jgi:hypothetical protein
MGAREALKIESHSKNGGVMNFALAILTLGAWVLMSQKMPTWNWFNKPPRRQQSNRCCARHGGGHRHVVKQPQKYFHRMIVFAAQFRLK